MIIRKYLVLVRGPCGSGKTTLCRGWAGRKPYDFALLSTDDVQKRVSHPELSYEDVFKAVLDHIGAEIARKLYTAPLLVDAGLRDAEHIDRILGPSGRTRGDPDVILVRLTVGVEEAVRRKGDLPESRVRELHSKWQTQPVAGETVLPTEGLSAADIAKRFGVFLADHVPSVGSTHLDGRFIRSASEGSERWESGDVD